SKPTAATDIVAPSATASITRCHSGRGPGRASTLAHVAATRATTPTTIQDRRSGCRADSTPVSGPVTTPVIAVRLSSRLAASAETPWPSVRNGTPHSSRNVFAGNRQTKWVKKPSQAPGSASTAATGTRAGTDLAGTATTGRG